MPDSIEISFRESVTAAQRAAVEESIASIVKRGRAEAEAARARLAEEDALREAVMAPLAKLIRADPAAAEAIEKLRKRQVEADDGLRLPVQRPVRDHTAPMSPPGDGVEVRVPPYDYAWSWHAGDPAFSQIGDRDGGLGIDSRSGSLPGGAGGRVEAHHGVGFIVRTDHPIVVELSSSRATRHSFALGTGLSGNATAEGGFDTTFMRGGTVLFGGTLPLFHRRVSNGERANERTNDVGSVYPDGMGGRIDPGEYNFNVGIWATADHAAGIGGAAAQSLVQSVIQNMRVHRRG